MSFITGLHGTVAAVLICILLFADEAGLPLPFAPNEVLLLLVGVLASSGAFPLPVIAPLAFVAMLLGMLAGYTWARGVGGQGLQALAGRVGGTAVYNRVQARLQTASPWGIAVLRMLPGLRPYATLVSGAACVDLRVFLSGALPALVLWEVLLVGAGVLVGLPLAHLLTRVERLVLRGGILLALGVVSWLAVRNASPDRRQGIARLAPRLRAVLALAVDTEVVLAFVGGSFAIARRLVHVHPGIEVELIVAVCVLIGVLLIGRYRQTPGERLFQTDYWHYADGGPGTEAARST